MKQMKRKLAAVVLAVATMCSVVLTGCSEKLAPADQVVGALYDLALKDNAKPMMDLLGFASEQDVKDSLMEDSTTSFSDMIKNEFEAVGVQFSDEELQEISDTMMNLINKLSYTAEITEESSKEVTVVLKVKSFSNADLMQVMTDAQTAAIENMDEETQMAIATGDEAATQEFLQQVVKDYLAKVGELEPMDGETEITVKCEKMKVDVSGKEKVAWMPSDMTKFSTDVDNSTFK